MAYVERNSFVDNIVIDLVENKIVSSGVFNLRMTFYDQDEIHFLDPNYKNFVFNNVLTELEFICDFDVFNKNTNFTIGRMYSVKLYDGGNNKTNYTEFQFILLKLERTQKSERKNRYFYSGIRINNKLIDNLLVFSNFTSKIYVILDKNGKNSLHRIQTEKEERDMIFNSRYSGCVFYDISDFVNDQDMKSQELTALAPSHLI